MRLSWLPEAVLDEHETLGHHREGLMQSSLELGAMWDEFRKLQVGEPLLAA